MRILMVLTEFPPRIGGMQTHAINLVEHLVKRGMDLEVVTYRAGDADETAAIESIDAAVPCPVHRCLSRIGYFHNLAVIERLGQRFKPDLIYTSTVFYGDLGARLKVPVVARSVGNDVMRPWIVYPYRFCSRFVSHPLWEHRLYRFFKRIDYPELIEAAFRRRRVRLMTKSARKYDMIFANSDFTASLLNGLGIRQRHRRVVTGGVDNDRFRLIKANPRGRDNWQIPTERFLLVTVCRLVKKKGLDFLIESMPQLMQTLPQLHLLIVGDGRQAKRLQKQALSSAASEHITFTGRIPHPEIEQAYACADAFVLASRLHHDRVTGIRDAETMGRVLCEANAVGLPVLAARSGGIPSVIEHEANGLLFEPDNLASLTTQLSRLVEDPMLRMKLIEEGRRRAKDRFDWSHIVAEHELTFRQYAEGYRGTDGV
ncbi:MAG: glycosyltransferase family 4 protein [Bradymonadia bacterium]